MFLLFCKIILNKLNITIMNDWDLVLKYVMKKVFDVPAFLPNNMMYCSCLKRIKHMVILKRFGLGSANTTFTWMATQP